MRWSLRLLVVGLVASAVIVVGMPAASASAAESEFVSRINGARSSAGKGALTTNSELTSIARRWSQRMADEQRLSHNSNLSREVTQDWEKLAENVGFGQDVAQIHEAFMNSPAHRANILDGALTHIGVGVVVDGSGQMWVTEVFMRLRGGGASPPPTTAAPAPPPTAAPAPTAPPPTAPPTTRAPRVTTPTTARPPAAPRPPAAAPAAPPVTEAPPPEPTPEPEPEPVAAPPPAPTMRLILVLDGLRALDHGR